MGACCSNRGYSKLDDPEFRTFPILRLNSDENIYTRQYPLQLVESNKNSWDTMKHFKIVFLGESKVGKTSIISQKVSYKFDEEYTPTMEDYFVKVHRVNVEDYDMEDTQSNNGLNSSLNSSLNSRKGSSSFSTRFDKNGTNYNELSCYHCILDIQDTSGSLDLRQNINQWIWRSQIFVVVFDIMSMESFKHIENQFISRIIDIRKCDQPPVILVGNKSDLIQKTVLSSPTSSISPRTNSAEISMTQYPNRYSV